MSDVDSNDYPSKGVQQYTTKIAFLIDCDGGLSAAFNPKNKHIINNDSDIVKRMENLKRNNSRVHLFGNIIMNSKNGADMNLSFILGTISKMYDTYVIIAPHDQAYKEIKNRLENTALRLKNHVELRQFDGPDQLAEYVCELNKVQNDVHCGQLRSATTLPITVRFTPENLFRHCPLESFQQSSRLYRFAEFLDHLNKHSEIHYHYCSTCEEMIQKDDWSPDRYQRFEKHFQKDHLDNNAGFCLCIQPI